VHASVVASQLRHDKVVAEQAKVQKAEQDKKNQWTN
jgi:hypothetical protein